MADRDLQILGFMAQGYLGFIQSFEEIQINWEIFLLYSYIINFFSFVLPYTPSLVYSGAPACTPDQALLFGDNFALLTGHMLAGLLAYIVQAYCVIIVQELSWEYSGIPAFGHACTLYCHPLWALVWELETYFVMFLQDFSRQFSFNNEIVVLNLINSFTFVSLSVLQMVLCHIRCHTESHIWFLISPYKLSYTQFHTFSTLILIQCVMISHWVSYSESHLCSYWVLHLSSYQVSHFVSYLVSHWVSTLSCIVLQTLAHTVYHINSSSYTVSHLSQYYISFLVSLFFL